jgi:hypothetical protein
MRSPPHGRSDTRLQKEADRLRRNKDREVRGTCRCAMPICLADLVPSYARKSKSFLRFPGGATYADLSSVKRRAESRRSKNNSNYTTPPRLSNESGPRGDLSSCSISFKPFG